MHKDGVSEMYWKIRAAMLELPKELPAGKVAYYRAKFCCRTDEVTLEFIPVEWDGTGDLEIIPSVQG